MRSTLLLGVLLTLLVQTQGAHADAYYKLINRYSGKCLDVEGDNHDNGGRVIQYTCFNDLGPTDQLMFRLWWWNPNSRMPDVYQFRDVWNATVEGSSVLDSILSGYGM